jgi:protein-tyrosine phosphatase
VIDLHTHVLPGLDDGAVDLDESVAICRAVAAEGVEAVAGTPHVREDYPTTPEAMRAALAQVREAVKGVIEVLPGGEVAVDELDRPLEELEQFGLAGNPGFLLVETPYLSWPPSMYERLHQLRMRGIVPVLAHPERNPDVQRRPELLEPVVALGTLVQLTAASVDGRFGRTAKACARGLLDRGLAHMIASDCHSVRGRGIGMQAAATAVADDRLARWLTFDVPAAIVGGNDVPPPPARSSRRGGLGRLRRRG